MKRSGSIDIFDKVQLKYFPYYVSTNSINTVDEVLNGALDEEECISFIKLYGCYIDLDITAVACTILFYPRALSTIFEIISLDEEYIKYFMDTQQHIKNQQKNIKADVFMSSIFSSCGTYYELKYCLLIQLLGLVFKFNEDLGIELGVVLFPTVRSWNVKYALVGSMYNELICPMLNARTNTDRNMQCDIFDYDQVFVNKDFFVGSRSLMKNEMESELIKIRSNKNDCANDQCDDTHGDGHDDNNIVPTSEWFYNKRKIYHRYLTKLLFCTGLDNNNNALKNKDLLMEWINLSFYLVTCQIDLTVSITQEIRYRIIDNSIMQNLLILFPIPSVGINDVSIYQFRIKSKCNSDNDEVYVFSDHSLYMNDIVSALCIKIIVNYSNMLELEPLLITEMCMNYGLYGCAIIAHEQYARFMQDSNKNEDIDFSKLLRILSDSLLILWHDENYRHESNTIIKETINLVTNNLYRCGKYKHDDIVHQLSMLYNESFNQYLFTKSNEVEHEDVKYVACIYCDIIFDAVGVDVGINIIKHADNIVDNLPFKYFQEIYIIL